MTKRKFFTLFYCGTTLAVVLYAGMFSSGNSLFSAENATDKALPGWPPRLGKSEDYNGRMTDYYQHGMCPEWGAKNPDQTDSFTVVHPKSNELRNAQNRPLYVVLHSAGHDLASCMKCTTEINNHDIYHSPDDFYALYVDCRKNEATDWWWGGLRDDEALNDQNRDKAGPGLAPVEKRVMATVHEVIKRYKIDPNRVYLCGNSMGGSGTLGIGLRHGDVFAAIKANVPAGCRHAATRLLFDIKAVPNNFSIPDPPVCVDYSGTNDRWARDHAVLFREMKSRHYSLIAFWGPFGHANSNKAIEKVNDLVNRFDWLAIRKDQPYPVFTDATCDNAIPWLAADPESLKQATAGQLNGFFRWENKSESAQGMEISLRIASNKEISSVIFSSPKEAVADVTLRRLGRLNPKPGEKFEWTFGTAHGTVVATQDNFAPQEKRGLITIPRLRLTTDPTSLVLKRK